MPEVVAPVAPVVAPTAPAAVKPVASVEPVKAAPQTTEDLLEIIVAGEKKTMPWNSPETRKAAQEALQKKGYAEKSISESRNAYKALEKQRADMANAFATAKAGDPSALLKMLGTEGGAAKLDPQTRAAVMKMLGVDPDAHARELLTQKLDMANMTPEQREIADLKAKNAEHEKALKQHGETRRQERVRLHARQQQAALFKELGAAGERIGLPADENSLAAIHQVMLKLHENEIPMTPDLIVELAKEEIDNTFRNLEGQVMKGMKGPALASRLGPEVMKELRTHLATDKEFIKEIRLALAAKLRSGKPLDEAPAAKPAAQTNGAPPTSYISQAQLDEQVKALAKRHGQ